MSARVFRSFRKIFSSSPKVVLLPLVFLFLFLTRTLPVSAADYSTYLSLFDGQNITAVLNGNSSPAFPSSGLFDPGAAGDLIQDATNKDVTGIVLNIALGFSSGDHDVVKAKWYDVQSNNDTFLIRVCDVADQTNCWVNTVPYDAYVAPDSAYADNLAIFEHKEVNTFSSDTWTQDNVLTNFPVLGSGEYGTQYKYTRDVTNDKGVIADFKPVKLQTPSSVEATLWYCAAQDGAKARTQVGSNNDTIATFDDLCGGDSYFRIGSPLDITIPSSAQAVTSQVNTQKAGSSNTGAPDNLPGCGIIWGQSGTINGCAAQLAYGIYYLCAWVAGLFGELFDFFIGYSVSSASYQYPFVVSGWTLVRNISNIFFIIIMVWTGFSAVFETEKTSYKKVVPALIINAFLINFSLFFTRVVIDVSNIGARMFYSEMLVCKQEDLVGGVCTAAKAQTDTWGYWPLSEKIVSSFDPQTMFKQSILTPPASNADGSGSVEPAATTASLTDHNSRDYANYFGVVSIIAAVIMIFMAIMFFKVAFLFLGRVVGLYICMIFSPFAFLSRDIPMLGSIAKLRWEDWKKDLTSYALLAPIFTFFLYIIYSFLSSNFIQQIGVQAIASAGFFATVMSIGIPMGIIFFLLKTAQEQAEKFSGDIGNQIKAYGEKATGFVAGAAVGLATGGASLAGTGLASATKMSEGRRAELQAKQAEGGWRGQLAGARLKTNDWTQRQTFDARNTKGMKFLNESFGMNPNNKAINVLGFGSDRTKGGSAGMEKRQAEETKKKIESIKVSMPDEKVPAFWQKSIEADAGKKYFSEQKRALEEKKKNATSEQEKDGIKKELEDLKKSKKDDAYKQNQKYKETLETETKEAEKTYGKVTNAKELTQATRLKYAKTLEREADETKPRDLLAAPLLVGSVTEARGRKKGAVDYINEQKGKQKKLNKIEEKNQKRENELNIKLAKLDGAIEEAYKNQTRMDLEAAGTTTGKSESQIEAIIKTKVEELKKAENAGKADDVLEKHREYLKNKIEQHDLEVQNLNDTYKETLKNNNNDPESQAVKDASRAVSAKMAERSVDKLTYEKLDPKKRDDILSSLSTISDKKEGAREKLEKGNEDKAKTDDKPKDEAK